MNAQPGLKIAFIILTILEQSGSTVQYKNNILSSIMYEAIKCKFRTHFKTSQLKTLKSQLGWCDSWSCHLPS